MRTEKSRVVSGKLRMKKIHCSKGGTNGTKNYPNKSYYKSAEVIHGDGIMQYRLIRPIQSGAAATDGAAPESKG